MPKCKTCGKQSSLFELDLFTKECAGCRKAPAEPDKNGYVSILDKPSNDVPDEPMDIRHLGIAFMIGGLILAFGFAFIYDPTLYSGGERINNIGKLNSQSNGIMFSVGIAIIGSIFYVGGRIESKIRS